MSWTQTTVRLPAFPRGCHLITSLLLAESPQLSKVQVGILHVFIQHTSASLTLNENADPDVRRDMEMALNHLVPETLAYVHTLEGPDDMPAHVKASLMGSSLSIPISNGKLALGTWQGIYLCEHRNHAEGRSIVLTLMS
jgi:secondary thiamine-phosphate synthase enzyme